MVFTIKFQSSDKEKTVDLKLIEELDLIRKMFDVDALLINFETKVVRVCDDYCDDEE